MHINKHLQLAPIVYGYCDCFRSALVEYPDGIVTIAKHHPIGNTPQAMLRPN
jgi:hypothetical protein